MNLLILDKRKFPNKRPWSSRKEDSLEEELSEDSFDEQEEADLQDLKDLLRALLDACRKLSSQLHQMPLTSSTTSRL